MPGVPMENEASTCGRGESALRGFAIRRAGLAPPIAASIWTTDLRDGTAETVGRVARLLQLSSR
ncbi:MAG: hypothetical protein SGPRY_008516 [Prymnesium sp.]